MDSITVRAGSSVKRGQVIGYMGDTGSPGAVHLHFEYWKSGGESAAVDPYPLLKSLCW
jgi:murein DD-endopeptidase MepM/ murein hydrolase activator NlpD